MKVVSKILAIMILVLSFSFCYAEEELVVDDSAQENLGVVDTESLGIEGFDEDEELKQYYQDYRDYLEEYYNTYERTPSIKARVLSAEEPKEKYQIDYTSYSIAKYVAQPLTVEILEGEYEGQTLEMDFILTGDSLNNIIVSKLEKGDTVFIDVIPNEDGTLTGSVSNAWASTERVSILLIIGIILALLLIIYGGKRGFTTALVVSIIIVFATIILPNFVFTGGGFIAVAILEIICLISAISVIHLGTNRNAFKAMLLAVIMTAVACLFIFAFNSITRTNGITFEAAAIADNIILNNVNFVHLYYLITLIIASVFITNTICMAVKKIDREGSQDYSEKIYNIRSVLPSNIIPLFATALTLYVPNHMLLISNKFNERDIINSETLTSELIRLFVITLCVVLVIPIVSLDVFKFGRKYLKEGEVKTEGKSEEKVEQSK